jgi:hypothetical protein
LQTAAGTLVLQVQVLQASGERDFDAAFATLRIKTIRKVVVRGVASPTILKVTTGRGDSVARFVRDFAAPR